MDWTENKIGMDKMILHNKIALITGSTRGIGKAIAVAFAAQGADIILNYKKQQSIAEEVRKQISGMDRRVLLIQADVTSPSEFKSMIDQVVDRFGRLDILVNNADDDQFVFEEAATISEEKWHLIVQGSLYSVYYGCKYAIEVMRKQGFGRIVNIAALGDCDFELANLCVPFYVAKSGVRSLTKLLAASEARNNIVINCVSPGFIDNFEYPDKVSQKLNARIPRGKLGTSEEVAQAVLFLASEEATYINGGDISVGGGI